MNLNKIQLAGRLTRDPEVRYTPKQTAVIELGLAVNRHYTVDGEKREDVTFVDVTFWGKTAEILAKYLKRGRSIYIEGRLKMDAWEDKESGKKRTRLGVVGENFQFTDSAPGGGGARSSAPTQKPVSSASGTSDDDDEIPF